ncbi:glycoside hydrolase family 38 C-terminal domain-containing protein [Companilactobacillus halodurans]|uniref:Alpha-mannosidase n=1 Tax=Companilactobacillus halodurans TaxID=2584183 RepID=A0A5P0ZZD4_9LACO|nr:glycoside hydrolase family 38 C-terminal domain-containing protein [Companilactobacillus halodurans]MQS76429.1 alpha-mannosidase [Companilactobacillus halodurans]MQS98453.1 alpha-mannosidase [Companilactobacillus halodurans]
MIRVSIVNHTHWDREWYFSSEDSIFLSDKLFTDAIEELEKNQDASFTLDGQISILNDYLEIRPEMTDSVKSLVKRGQLIIGPWFTQPDALHIKGESLIRNGMIGILDSQKYGQYLNVGYLPDTFGFNSQMPVILNHLGISSFIFWRGLDVKKVGGYYFNWKSLGKENNVTAVNMPQGYSTGMLLDDNRGYVDKRLDNAVDFIRKVEKGNDILIPSGNDQLDIIKDFGNKINRINDLGKYEYEITDYQSFINKISNRVDLPDYVGEFIDPVLARVHRTSSSSRMNIKLESKKLEMKLIKTVEPMLVISNEIGVDISHKFVVRAWKKLLESQAHDSMAGSVTDSVERDIIQRIKEGQQIADDIINMIENLISRKIQLKENEVLLFNTTAHRTNRFNEITLLTAMKYPGLKDCKSDIISQKYVEPRENVLVQNEIGNHYIKENGYYISKILVKVSLPALGFKVFQVTDQVTDNDSKEKESTDSSISNDKYMLSFHDGKLKIQTADSLIDDALLIEDVPNDGDTYDFSPLENGHKRMLEFNKCSTKKFGSFSEMILEGTEELPVSQVQKQYQGQTHFVNYRMRIYLLKSSETIRFRFEFDNEVLDHRIRVGFRTRINSESHIASVPFGFIKRTAIEKKNPKWAEVPVCIYPFDDSVTVKNNEKFVSLVSNDISEYQQVNGIIWLTVLATTNELGKPNLGYRPGRASGDTTKSGHIMIKTPDAEVLSNIVEEFGLIIGKEFDEETLKKYSNNLALSIPCYQYQNLNLFYKRLDNKIQFPNIDHIDVNELEVLNLPDNYLVSSIYPAYFNESGYIVRLENVSRVTKQLDKKLFGKNSKEVNAIEKVQNNKFKIPPMGICSIEVDD